MTNQKLTLRKVKIKDIDKLYEWWTNGKLMATVGYPEGLAINKKDVYQSIKEYQEDEHAQFMMVLNEQGKEIGEFAYSKKACELYTFDIKIGELDYQGKGYEKRALIVGMQIIKRQENVKKIEIGVAPENQIALNLYKSVGFKTIKAIKDNWKAQLGEMRSTEILELSV